MSTTPTSQTITINSPVHDDKRFSYGRASGGPVSPSGISQVPTTPTFVHTAQATKMDLGEAKRSQFKSLAGQFACYVGISTFTGGLVVGFLSLSRALVDMPPLSPLSLVRSSFEVGLALGMASIGLHLGVILVGIRASALCIRRSAIPHDLESGGAPGVDQDLGDPLKDLTAQDFYRYIRYCERLQLLGSLFFIATLIYMSFLMFKVGFWPWVLLGASIIGLLTLMNAGVWKMSILWESVHRTTQWFSRLYAGNTSTEK